MKSRLFNDLRVPVVVAPMFLVQPKYDRYPFTYAAQSGIVMSEENRVAAEALSDSMRSTQLAGSGFAE